MATTACLGRPACSLTLAHTQMVLVVSWLVVIASAAGAMGADVTTYEQSPAWYLLQQPDTNGLLHGMLERTDSVSGLSSRQTAIWQGVEEGYQLQLTIGCEENIGLRVALFRNPQWWLAAPVQVREIAGPGSHVIDRLPAGTYYIGAVQRVGDETIYGVEKQWPQPVVIAAGTTAQAEVLLSRRFRNRPFGVGGLTSTMIDGSDLTNLTSVKVIEEQTGQPVPYCRLVLREHPTDLLGLPILHSIQGNGDGVAYIGKMKGRFSVSVQRFDFVPEKFAIRYVSLTDDTLHDPTTLPDVEVVIGGYPTGRSHLRGKVHDQFGKPLTTYYMTLSDEPTQANEAPRHAIRIPVIDESGRFHVGNLASGRFRLEVRHFDYAAYEWRVDDHRLIDVPLEDTNAEVDVQIEAKELRFCQIVDENGQVIRDNITWLAGLGGDRSLAFGAYQPGLLPSCVVFEGARSTYFDRRRACRNIGPGSFAAEGAFRQIVSRHESPYSNRRDPSGRVNQPSIGSKFLDNPPFIGVDSRREHVEG